MRITKEILNNFNECPVEVVDCNGFTHKGWFIKIDNEYKLFSFDTIWNVYVYKASHIKSIKHLTNSVSITAEDFLQRIKEIVESDKECTKVILDSYGSIKGKEE